MVQLLPGLWGNAVLTQNPEPTLRTSNHGMSTNGILSHRMSDHTYLVAPFNVEFFKSFFVCLVYLCKKRVEDVLTFCLRFYFIIIWLHMNFIGFIGCYRVCTVGYYRIGTYRVCCLFGLSPYRVCCLCGLSPYRVVAYVVCRLIGLLLMWFVAL